MALTLYVNGTAHGIVINPGTVAAQEKGGALFGLTVTRYGAITLKGGRVERSNFHNYRTMRMNEVPVEAPAEFGGAAYARAAPAVTSASFAITGKRIRGQPIDSSQLQF